MGKTMMSNIREQPQTLRAVLEKVPEELPGILRETGTDFDAVYLVGSGSSLNAAYAAKSFFEQYTRALVLVMTSFDFLHYYPENRLNSRSLVLGISQTARSTGTIDAVTRARRCGAMTVFVTAEPQNEGARCAHTVFDTCTGEELVGAKTKGYTSTMAALFLLAGAMGGQSPNLDAVPGWMEQTLAETERVMPALTDEFAAAPAFTVVGYGPGISNVYEGGLKLLETVRVPTERYDVEEYMHGPYHCLEDSSRLLFLAPEGAGQERMARLIRFCGGITAHTLVVGNSSFVREVGGHFSVALPDGMPEELAPLCTILPLQWLANDLTLRKGRRPEASRYPLFHKMLGSKFMPKINYYTGE